MTYPSFQSPAWLWLLPVLLPAVWWYSYRRLAGLGSVRRWVVLITRSLVLTLLVFALAELQFVQTSDRLTVIYLLDQSMSIPEQDRREMIRYVNAAIREHRRGKDRVGVIVFGRDAAVEIPPYDDNVQIDKVETLIDRENTNLAAAMKLAQALFPEDAAKRVVVVSDGNQNLGDAAEQAEALGNSGVSIDVLPVRYQARAELSVDRVALPPDARRGQPFDLRIVVGNNPSPTGGGSGEVAGRLMVTRSYAGRTETVCDEPKTLIPGKNVFTVRQKIDTPNFYTYEAQFIPKRPQSDDTMSQNNRASGFTHVRGKGRVLLVEDSDHPGEFDYLVSRLGKQGLEVETRKSEEFFTTLAELQPYDTVILANVARDQLSDNQIAMLVSNTHQMGAGLVMLGSPNSFGAGGWTNTEIEQAMPVDFQIRSPKVIPQGALVMIMHASEMAAGNYWQKVIVKSAIKTLGPQDYCGVLHWDNMGYSWLWSGGNGMLQVGPARNKMLALVDRMEPQDMPDFDPPMVKAYNRLKILTDAAVKHMVIISDGDPSTPAPGTMINLKKLNVTVSTVAIGAHGGVGSATLRTIALQTGGKYYAVGNPKALPRIFQREARRLARPLVWDKEQVQPRVRALHEMLNGVTSPLPPIRGFVLTSKKQNPLVETLLTSPRPEEEENNTLLACWTYGLGRTVAFTSDAGARWTTGWEQQEIYDKLFGQMIRWSMRPAGGTGKFTVTTGAGEEQGTFIINALDKNDEFLNFLNMNGRAVGPDMKPVPVKIEQIAPGRYQGTFDAKDPGAYLFMVLPGAGQAPIRFGVNVPYSREFLDRQPNEPLLDHLAKVTPQDGKPGLMIEIPPNAPDPMKALLKPNSFRHDLPQARSSQEAWQYALLLACCLFFTDIFFRRVQISLEWLKPWYEWILLKILRRAEVAAQPMLIDRLKSKKAEVDQRIEQLRGAVRFELPKSQKPPDTTVLEESPAAQSKTPPPAPGIAPEKSTEESYTERLLKAKKKIWDDREKDGGEKK
ncbi:MAG: VWA domain-containing protein [Pirellulales bacterium]|nr:VWA domain-containing protein [Pirellulales bacterium]